jgi:hypothetical protein
MLSATFVTFRSGGIATTTDPQGEAAVEIKTRSPTGLPFRSRAPRRSQLQRRSSHQVRLT